MSLNNSFNEFIHLLQHTLTIANALESFSHSILFSFEVFMRGSISNGYFVSRWVTNNTHSGIPFFFSKGLAYIKYNSIMKK